MKEKPLEVAMKRAPCSQCKEIWPEDELLKREDNGEVVCPDCSGLIANEDLSCQYDETD